MIVLLPIFGLFSVCFILAFVCLLGLLYTPAYYPINTIVYHHNKLIKLKSNIEVNI